MRLGDAALSQLKDVLEDAKQPSTLSEHRDRAHELRTTLWPQVSETRYSLTVGSDLQRVGEQADTAFESVVSELEAALRPAFDGNVYLWNGELRALRAATGFHDAMGQVFNNDAGQYEAHRLEDAQIIMPHPPPGP